jgi:S-formylglutathione hydrolase FrmB
MSSRAGRPARVVATEVLGPRVRDLVIDSPALGRYAMVRLLLPRRFAAEPGRRWPVLWLLHGCCDTYQSWTRSTDIQQLAGLAEVLVVMPEAGQVGFYSDWHEPGRGGPSRWERFHLTELRQLLERDWRAGNRRVVAGLSMGGLGAMAYAARHPGMFEAAASYSGLLHTRYQGDPVPGPQLIQGLLRQFGEDADALWGNPRRHGDVWAAHNPYHLAPRLQGVRLFVSFGNGQAGPLDKLTGTGEARQIERNLYPQNLAFVERLRQLGIPVRSDAYGPGTHDWPYWQRELHRSLPMLLDALHRRHEGDPTRSPSRTHRLEEEAHASVPGRGHDRRGGGGRVRRPVPPRAGLGRHRPRATASAGRRRAAARRPGQNHPRDHDPAPPAAVWPWLVQMGWGRAGWSTYRWVDRLLFPANGPSADRILPEHQRLATGDQVPDGPPEADCWFTVERLEPNRLLVLRSTRHLPASWRQRGLAMDWIWSWQLDEPVPGRTRVIQRNRMRLEPAWFERAFLATIVPADFIMARSHLRGLRRLAQGPASSAVRNPRISRTAGR